MIVGADIEPEEDVFVFRKFATALETTSGEIPICGGAILCCGVVGSCVFCAETFCSIFVSDPGVEFTFSGEDFSSEKKVQNILK